MVVTGEGCFCFTDYSRSKLNVCETARCWAVTMGWRWFTPSEFQCPLDSEHIPWNVNCNLLWVIKKNIFLHKNGIHCDMCVVIFDKLNNWRIGQGNYCLWYSPFPLITPKYLKWKLYSNRKGYGTYQNPLRHGVSRQEEEAQMQLTHSDLSKHACMGCQRFWCLAPVSNIKSTTDAYLYRFFKVSFGYSQWLWLAVINLQTSLPGLLNFPTKSLFIINCL